jgi:hypothetical protein
MLDSWMLSKLEPLNGCPLIILRDPQCMILRGAHVVDGWAAENGYAVLFCTGNLGLRDLYEARRDGPDGRILVVDRRRKIRPPKSGRLRRS